MSSELSIVLWLARLCHVILTWDFTQDCTGGSKNRHQDKRTNRQTNRQTLNVQTNDVEQDCDHEHCNPRIVFTPSDSCNIPRVILLEYELADHDDVFEKEADSILRPWQGSTLQSNSSTYYRPQTAYLKPSHSTKTLNSYQVRVSSDYENGEGNIKSKLNSILGAFRRRARYVTMATRDIWGTSKRTLSRRLTRSMFLRPACDSSLHDLSNVEVEGEVLHRSLHFSLPWQPTDILLRILMYYFNQLIKNKICQL